MESRIEAYFDRLWPICRSIMGPGYRESLQILSEIVPFDSLIYKTGEKVFDWTVPREWVPRTAYFIDHQGKKHADFNVNNLHLMSHSMPFKGHMSFDELRPHLHSCPELPTAIPYLTTYYEDQWGFCLSHDELKSLPQGEYNVCIDTQLSDGELVIGEAILPGELEDEVLFSTYLCHPSMANNELSGPLVMNFLYEKIRSLKKRRYTYRFVIAPETIGSLCYLKTYGDHLKEKLKAGFVVRCIGDRGNFTYQKSRRGDTIADKAVQIVLRDQGKHQILPFDVNSGDERQYCSPGFNLPVGSLMRTPHKQYKEYHTSLDDKNFISFESIVSSVETYEAVVRALEENHVWRGTILHGEPQLGKRGLYPTLGPQANRSKQVNAMMWLLNLADGTHDLLSIADRSGEPIALLISLADQLFNAGLLEKVL